MNDLTISELENLIFIADTSKYKVIDRYIKNITKNGPCFFRYDGTCELWPVIRKDIFITFRWTATGYGYSSEAALTNITVDIHDEVLNTIEYNFRIVVPGTDRRVSNIEGFPKLLSAIVNTEWVPSVKEYILAEAY